MILDIVSETEVKKGRRLYGHLIELADGQVIYLAKRKHGQIYRAGKASISSALADGDAAWAMDEVTLFGLRAKKVQKVGVRVVDTGDLYLTDLANYFDLKKAKVKDYSDRGGARQRYLPLQYFDCWKGKVELDLRKIAA